MNRTQQASHHILSHIGGWVAFITLVIFVLALVTAWGTAVRIHIEQKQATQVAER